MAKPNNTEGGRYTLQERTRSHMTSVDTGKYPKLGRGMLLITCIYWDIYRLSPTLRMLYNIKRFSMFKYSYMPGINAAHLDLLLLLYLNDWFWSSKVILVIDRFLLVTVGKGKRELTSKWVLLKVCFMGVGISHISEG